MTYLFDQAIALQKDANATGHYSGATHPAWMNMVGPFGGITGAALLQAVLQHPQLLGEPVAMTVNFCAAVADGAYQVQAKPVRTNRSTQHWTMQITQNGETVITGTAMTAVRRQTWSAQDEPMPLLGKPNDYNLGTSPLPWTQRYEMRVVVGPLPSIWDGTQDRSLTQLWVRDAQQRALDMASLAALCDVFFPRVYIRRAKLVPIGTVSLTMYFHCDAAQLAELSKEKGGFVLGQARGLNFRNGFFDQTALVWSANGHLLASTHQIVYYKE